jgi:GntR family transcriptional regulator, vanillate catabolism transcriptional regulator
LQRFVEQRVSVSLAADKDLDRSVSQTMKAVLSLRELILSGELGAGERISELAIVERFGVSRTPIRTALVRLAEEGLLEPIPSGGFAVRAFRERDIADALEIRGALEGLAARRAAERGPSAGAIAPLRQTLAALDQLVARLNLTVDDLSEYIALNATFHSQLVDLADNPTLTRQIERVCALPFASPSGFVMVQAVLPESRMILNVAQEQHRSVVEAIEQREGARANAVMCEHPRLAMRNLQIAMRNQQAFEMVPGAALIRRRGRP